MEIVNIAQRRALMQLDAVLEFIESCDSMPEHVLRECKMSYRNLRAKIKYHGESVDEYDDDDEDMGDFYVPSSTIKEFLTAYDDFVAEITEVDDPFTYKRDNVVFIKPRTPMEYSEIEDNDDEKR